MNLKPLKKFIPENSLPIIQHWIDQCPVNIKITKKRTTKFGDFKVNYRTKHSTITVNNNLNKYAFLITFTHEYAHFLVWKKYQHQAKAHGKEWKDEFIKLLSVLLKNAIFPPKLTTILNEHLKNPPASTARDPSLMKELKKYDLPSQLVYLSELPEGTAFMFNNNRVFIKGEKKRTRFVCIDKVSKKKYLINGIAEVLQLDLDVL